MLMSARDWLHLGQMVWVMAAVAVIPRYVRSLKWVTIIAVAGSLANVWLTGVYGGRYVLDLDERLAWGFVVVVTAMVGSEVQFRHKHGWWRCLDGEAGRHRRHDGESEHPEVR